MVHLLPVHFVNYLFLFVIFRGDFCLTLIFGFKKLLVRGLRDGLPRFREYMLSVLFGSMLSKGSGLSRSMFTSLELSSLVASTLFSYTGNGCVSDRSRLSEADLVISPGLGELSESGERIGVGVRDSLRIISANNCGDSLFGLFCGSV